MAKFSYSATDTLGKRRAGVLRGTSAAGVRQNLETQGLAVGEVKLKKRSWLDFEITSEKVDRVELANFSRQMAAFMKAGVPILDALEVIQKETKDKKLRSMLGDVRDSLRFGESFASAMAEHDKALPPFYISVLRSAEAVGELDIVMAQLANYIQRDNETRRTITSALIYPALVMGLAVIVVLVMVIFVLPRFQVFFDSFDATMPLPTRMLMWLSDFAITYYPAILALMVASMVGLIVAFRREKSRMVLDRILLRVPGVGPIIRDMVVERFCRILSSMVRAGVPMPDALQLAADGAHNRVYRNGISRARRTMLEGAGISGPLAATKLFPGTVTQMVRVGEETGSLDDQLEHVAEYLGHELEHRLKALTSVIEPVIIVVVGCIVGFVAVAMVSAIYGVFSQVKV